MSENAETPFTQESQGRFPYSVENPPPISEIESKVFAVHSTPILPKNGVLKAGARDTSYGGKWDDEPPSFRPTIHFSLGEIVKEHHGFSWDENPYAIVTPIKSLEGQLINIFPNDTFVLGDYRLTPEDILLVPKGTDVSKLPPEVNVLEYNDDVGLRGAVDQVIKDKNGWQFRMQPEGVAIGSVAYIDGEEINSAEFFSSLYEKLPQVSYGTHLNPERGDAFRFGLIEHTLNILMKTYSDHWYGYGNSAIRLYRGIVTHNLARLEYSLQAQTLQPEATQAFEDKKRKLEGWLNIVDADLDLRERLGVTLSGASEWAQKQVRRHRYSPEDLKLAVEIQAPSLKPVPEDEPISASVLAEMLQGMSPEEIKEFMAQNPEPFQLIELPRFYASYAIGRWLIIKSERAHEEGLDQMLAESVRNITPDVKKDRESEIFRSLQEYLTTDNNRLATALEILRQPSIMDYLTQRFGYKFTEDGPQSIEDVIRAHPEVKLIFEQQDMELNVKQQEAYRILTMMKRGFKPRYDRQEALTSFRKASSLAFEMKWNRDLLQRDLETITKPLNTIRNPGDIRAGSELTLYEQFQRDNKNAADIWKKAGLDQEFRKKFPTDKEFWDSPLPLVEIYKMLEAEKALEF